ncbi:type II secretion system protein [Paucibacter sp. TC2R-5]|uniref:type IV pilus modification PilV family protein n=1 Tax=Paucibacter sp. TC2R-5 TaxID=2893555 RepID=UPI0021E36B70|nr:type II secretion system protein [Paucibacter sp. TC2R-5]
MRKPRQQRGDALIEAMVAMVLLGVIGLGLVYAVSRAMVAQKFQKGQSLAIQAIRADLQGNGVANSCPVSGNATVTSDLTLGTNLQLTGLQKTCTVTPVTVTINGVAKSTNLPIVRFAVDADTLLGPGTLTVTN